MSQISAKDVKNLRDITGVGMMDCKKKPLTKQVVMCRKP